MVYCRCRDLERVFKITILIVLGTLRKIKLIKNIKNIILRTPVKKEIKHNSRDKINYPSSNKKGDWIISKRQKLEFQFSTKLKT